MARYSLAGAVALALCVAPLTARAQLSNADAVALLKRVRYHIKTGQHEKGIEELAGGNDIRATKMLIELATRWGATRLDRHRRAVPIEGLMPSFERAFSRINDPESWSWLYKELRGREFDKIELMWVRFAAAKGLAMKPEDHAYDKLMTMMRHDDPALSLAGAWGLQERYGDLRSKEGCFEALSDERWQVRYHGLIGLLRGRAALGDNAEFLKRLDASKGRERADLLRAMRTLSGKPEWTLADWKAWLDKLTDAQRQQFRADHNRFRRDPALTVSRREALEVEQGKREPFAGPTLFGIKLRSQRVAIVFDLHEKLRELKPNARSLPPGTATKPGELSTRDLIREEVAQAIEAMADGTQLALFVCDSDASPIESQMTALDDKLKAKLAGSVRERRSYLRSNLYDAFEAVYGMYGRDLVGKQNLEEGPDTVVLITPGDPETGEIAYRKVTLKGRLPWDQDFLRRWRAVSRARAIRWHVVAVGPKAQTTFLRRLAERTEGAFVHVR